MKVVPLESVCEIHVGRTPARADSTLWGGGEPWLSISDMNQGPLIEHTKEQITAAGAAKGRQVAQGTVLLSFKLSIGKVAVAGMPLFTNEAIAALPVRDPSTLDERYLMRALGAMDLGRGSNRAAMGGTLNKAMLKQIQIPLPDLDEQRRIAAILDHADTLRAKRRQILAHLDDLTQSIFHDMFGDPIANPGRYELFLLDSWIDEGRPITYGILKPGPPLEGGIPYIRVADMKDGGIELRGVRRTSSEVALAYRRSKLRTGDLLMSIRGHVGRFAHIPESLDGANITQDSARISVSDRAQSIYVRAAMESPGLQRWMVRHTKGVAVRGLNIGDLRRVPIPRAPRGLQQSFADRVSVVNAQRMAARSALILQDELFASLQSRAFRGEL